MAAIASYLEFGRFKAVPFSLSSLRSCPCRPVFSSTLTLALPPPKIISLGLVFDHPNRVLQNGGRGSSARRRIVTAVAHPEPDRFDERNLREKDDKANKLSTEVDTLSKDQQNVNQLKKRKDQQNVNQLKKRIFFGVGIGIIAGIIILAGEWVFTAAVAAAVFTCAREYFQLVRSCGITSGMTPPPRFVSRVCSVICALMPIATLYFGNIDFVAPFAAFFVGISLLLQRGNPRFAQLSSAVFGLIYCGYLPCFWIKLRCASSVPALNTRKHWPILLGGEAHWTVGLVATLISCSSIIAADTFAFMGGKAFGRTPLISVSPKKTWEGTIMGLGGCIATSVVLSKFLYWPTSLLSALAFGFLNFFGSIFGDLMESMIKRDAGVKDSGSLIPGHGGILDRVDSYIFTGALLYSFIKIFFPLYGV